MIVKNADDKSAQLDELNRLLNIAPAGVKPKVEAEIRMLRAGIKGEQETSFHLNGFFKDTKNIYIIHDLRLEHNGRTAQIDHILINRLLDVYVLETKQLHAGMKINEEGEFLQWNHYRKAYEGMASPLAQNIRHIDVLKEVFKDKVDMPTRLGFTLRPKYHSRILVNSKARIDRPKKFDTSEIVKSDDFFKKYQESFDEVGFVDAVSGLAKIISPEQADFMCRKLIRMHQPITYNYAAKFGIKETAIEEPKPIETITEKPAAVQQERAAYSSHQCSKCSSDDVKVAYGKFGYYFKCSACDGNTGIKIDCGVKGHKERIRKKGKQFYRDCADCQTSTLFFEN